MNVKIHARNIDPKLRVALTLMAEYTMKKLVPSTRTRNSITIDVHMKHHDQYGEATLDLFANRYRPRDFHVYLDHHRMVTDDYERVRDATEWRHEILKTLGHELVHVKQYVTGELTWRAKGLYYKGIQYDPENLIDYFDLPYEIEAYGRERGLLVAFLAFWSTNIEGELDLDD